MKESNSLLAITTQRKTKERGEVGVRKERIQGAPMISLKGWLHLPTVAARSAPEHRSIRCRSRSIPTRPIREDQGKGGEKIKGERERKRGKGKNGT